MTKEEILHRIFLSACITLLFFQNVRSYPHVEINNSTRNGNQTISDQSFISVEPRSFYNNPKLSNQANEHGSIFVFPMEDVSNTNSPSIISPRLLPKVCSGLTYCETIPDYPEKIINSAIQQNDSIKFLVNLDSLPDLTERIGVDETSSLCESTVQVIYPQFAKSKNKGWLIVVNHDNYKQGVRVDKCSQENSECNIQSGVPEGYKTTCQQKYIYRRLGAVSETGKIIFETFAFPSSCCCHVKFLGSTATRLGIFGDQRNKQTIDINNRRK